MNHGIVHYALTLNDQPAKNATNRKLKDAEVLGVVCAYYSTTRERLFKKARYKEIVWPRHVAMTLIYEYCGMGVVAIGRIFSKDHTTVLTSKRRVYDLCYTEPTTKNELNTLRDQLDSLR